MRRGDDIVAIRGLSKSFTSEGGVVPAVINVDLSVRAGELLMLVGPSGCGKTTLLSIIAGIMRPDSGSCLVLGHELTTMRDSELTTFRKRNIGFVFQAYNLIPTLTVAENVAIPLILQGVPFSKALERAEGTLTLVGLADKVRNRPTQLSGGQQQRVAIARALIHEPSLIVCDEPTSALDLRNGLKVMDLFREVAVAEGRALIVVSHDARIFHYADRIAEMDDGKLVGVRKGPDKPVVELHL